MNRFFVTACYFTAMLFSLGQLGRISFQNQLLNGYWYEIGMGVMLIILFGKYGLRPLKHIVHTQKLIVVFLAYIGISFLLSTMYYSMTENFIAFLYLSRVYFYNMFSLYLWYHDTHEKQWKYVLLNALMGIVVVTIITSVIQYWLFPNLRIFFYDGWDPHHFRMVGLYFDPPITAAIYGLSLLWLLCDKKIQQHSVWLRYGVSMLLVVCLFLSYSRGAYIAALATLFFFLTKTKYAKYFIAIVIMFMGVLFLLPRPSGESVNLLRTSTIGTRYADYGEGIQIWQKNPILGIGYNHIRFEKEQKNTLLESYSHSGASFHSSFLIILVTSGIVGLVLFAGVLWQVGKTSFFAQLACLYVGVLSLTDNVLLHPFILFFLGVVLISYGYLVKYDHKSLDTEMK